MPSPRPLLLAGLALSACLRVDPDAPSADAGSSGEAGSTTEDSGVPINSVTGEDDTEPAIETSTAGSTSAGSSSAGPVVEDCDDDPACGPDEGPETCPSQCTVCGDGVVSGAEACDNGDNTSPDYADGVPDAAACAPGCRAVGWCGDGEINGPEPCDGGGAQTAGCELGCRIPDCGDGVLNPIVGEVCDDGNLAEGDGCAVDCRHTERKLFVTSARFAGDLDYTKANQAGLKSIELADARCQKLSETAYVPGVFKAWLADGPSSPAGRLDTTFTGHYRLLDAGHTIVATGWADLTDGTLAHAIDRDENGDLVEDDLVWTNVGADGGQATHDHCNHWSLKTASMTTTVGSNKAVDATWTDYLSHQTCAGTWRLYCIEDP